MKGFGRALAGEVYAWTHKRSWLWSLIGCAALGAGRVVLGRLLAAPEDAAWNFYPQFASGARSAFFLAELLTIVLLASALPREAAAGAARDPLVRGIARSAWIAARACVGLLLPLTFIAAGLLGAGGAAAALFDAGDVIENGDVLLAADDHDVALAATLTRAILHGLPPLLALAAVALALAAAARHAVIAVGAGLALLLAPLVLHDALGDAAPWFFPDVLAGLGADSYLERVAQFARGYVDAYPETFDAVVATGWVSPLPALILGWAAAMLLFRRRAV